MTNRATLYFENLDALRSIAALMVVGAHLSTVGNVTGIWGGKILTIFLSLDGAGGDIGVSFFFVLSGFLITYLMLREFELRKSFALGDFYLRRMLRIWPLYYLILFIGFIVYPLIKFHHFENVENGNPLMYIFFLANFDQIYFTGPSAEMLGVLWSVSVEEQFYLLWPVVFLLTRDKRKMVWILFAILLISLCYGFFGSHKFHTLVALNDLSVGALVAYVAFFYQNELGEFFNKLGRPLITMVYVAGACMLVLNFQLNKHLLYYGFFDRLLHSLFFAFVIADQNFSNQSPMKVKSIPFLTHLGKISYGIYMYHVIAMLIAIQLCQRYQLNFYWQMTITLLLTLCFSELSYRYFESYFLRLKERFSKI